MKSTRNRQRRLGKKENGKSVDADEYQVSRQDIGANRGVTDAKKQQCSISTRTHKKIKKGKKKEKCNVQRIKNARSAARTFVELE
jgi:hypothetical protein